MLDDLITILAVIAMVLLIIICVFGICYGITEAVSEPDPYPLVCRVCEVDRDNNAVVFEDYNGFLWKMSGAEDWDEGDCAVLMMEPNDTPSIFDDEIISARYSAWTIWR